MNETCKVCLKGTALRSLEVTDWRGNHKGTLGRFCSNECFILALTDTGDAQSRQMILDRRRTPGHAITEIDTELSKIEDTLGLNRGHFVQERQRAHQ